MAIDTKSLTEVITEFRALQSKDAVSPESLGSILQRIVDLLATAGTSETVNNITKLLDGFKAAGQAITALSQGQSDRNHIYVNKSTVNLATGAVASTSGVFIQQATTDRAGAMRAQQVLDLNAAKKGVSDLQTQVANINSLITQLQSAIGGSSSTLGGKANISVLIENGTVRVSGINALIAAGCVPYIFRHTKKRNQYHHRKEYDPDPNKKYCSKRKGWNLWGSRNAVRVVNDVVYFSINPKSELTNEAVGWSATPTTLVKVYRNRNGLDCVGWGRSIISLHDAKDGNKRRMVRLRFAIAFGQPLGPGRVRVSPNNMLSNLAEFAVIYNAPNDTWSFSR